MMDTETLVLKIKELNKEFLRKANEAKDAYFMTDESEENLRAYYLAVNEAYIAASEKIVSKEIYALAKLFKNGIPKDITDERFNALVD